MLVSIVGQSQLLLEKGLDERQAYERTLSLFLTRGRSGDDALSLYRALEEHEYLRENADSSRTYSFKATPIKRVTQNFDLNNPNKFEGDDRQVLFMLPNC